MEQSPFLKMPVTMKGLSNGTEGELQTLREEEKRGKVGRRRLQKRYILVAVVVLVICATAVIVHTTLQLRSNPKRILVPPNPETPLPPSNSEERYFRKAAVCSDGPPCAEIGKKEGSLYIGPSRKAGLCHWLQGLRLVFPAGTSGRCCVSPNKTALEDHILWSGQDIKAMVSQSYYCKPREFFGEEMLTYLHWEVPKNDPPFFGTFTVPLYPSVLGISARKIFLMNGSVVDAAVATLICNGMVNSQSMGLGGGFMMTLYLREHQTAITLNARESAPLRSNADMYNEDSERSKNGVMAVGVPGELMGYWEAHQRYGWLPWEQVIMPTINVCEEGYIMNKHQSDSLGMRAKLIRKDPILRKLFVNPETGEFFRYGERIRPKEFCETLKIIAAHGGNSLYNGTLAKIFVSDIQQMGGIITEEDMANYRVKWDEPVTVNLRDKMTLLSTPPPGSGILLGFILNILDGYNFTSESIKDINSTILTYHRIIEAFKFAYARRTELGDADYVNITSLLHRLESKDYGNKIRQNIDDSRAYTEPAHYGAVDYSVDDHGTAHVSIIAPNGDAASITSTVNLYFGAGITSHRTGIILNSGMNDFSIPKTKSYFGIPFSSANIIKPGKRAVSSMCPSVIVNRDGDVRLVIGASGGTKITTAVAYVIMRILWFGESIKQAVDASRIHHQIFPMEVAYDYGVLDQIIKGLERLGHKTERIQDRGSIICALAKMGNMITANADFRKAGDVFGID